MAGHAVLRIHLRVLVIAALVVKLESANRTVLHAGAAAEALVAVDFYVLAAGGAHIKELGQCKKLFCKLGKMRGRCIRIAARLADRQLIVDLPVQKLALRAGLLAALGRAYLGALQVVLFDDARGADKCAGPASDAVLGALPEGAYNFPVLAAACKLNGAGLDDFIAGAHALAAHHAVVVFLAELGRAVGYAVLGGKLFYPLHIGAAGKQQLDHELPACDYPRAVGLHRQAVGNRICARGFNRRATVIVYLNYTQAAGPIGLKSVVGAQGRNIDPCCARRFKHARAFRCLYFFTVYCKCHHKS